PYCDLLAITRWSSSNTMMAARKFVIQSSNKSRNRSGTCSVCLHCPDETGKWGSGKQVSTQVFADHLCGYAARCAEEAVPFRLDFVHSEIGASADLRMDKVTFNC